MTLKTYCIIIYCIGILLKTQAQYCVPNVLSNPIDTGITNVVLDVVNHSSVAGEGYVDNTNVDTATLFIGGKATILVTVPTISVLRGFIDYNQDGFFSFTGEACFLDTLSPGVNKVEFTVPGVSPFIMSGYTRMRIAVGTTSLFNPCNLNFSNGDIEDYTVRLIEKPITVDSATTKQPSPCCFTAGSFRKDILGVEIHISGTQDSLIINDVTFNLSGTTNIADISKVELWYTGTEEAYLAWNLDEAPSLMHRELLGTISNPSSGDFIFNTNLVLKQSRFPEKHYLWLTSDITGSSAVGNTLNANCVNLTIDSSGTSLITVPKIYPSNIEYSISVSSNHDITKKVNHWYFGGNAGVDFNCDPPKAVVEGRLNVTESIASIADDQGKLLFYSNGITVYNALHDTMDNGTDLIGHYIGGHGGAMIIPKPGSNVEYYLFSGLQGCDTFRYGLIDMSLNGGLGRVIIKNQFLADEICEYKIAVHHCNKEDIWLILVKGSPLGTISELNAYQISNTGISAPVVSNLPAFLFLNNSRPSNHVASPNGRKLAFSSRDGFYLLDFDNSTGNICDPLLIPVDLGEYVYGLTFSPDNSKVYASSGAEGKPIYQFDMMLNTNAEIIASKTMIYKDTMTVGQRAFQNGPNGKTYVATGYINPAYFSSDTARKYYLDAINNPNELGLACNYEHNALSLAGRGTYNSSLLPKFIDSYFLDPDWRLPLELDFDYTTTCLGDTTTFTNNTIYTDSSCLSWPLYHWDFGDSLSGSKDTSSLINPTHLYTKPGIYTVTLISSEYCDIDTMTKTILVLSDTTYSFPDTSICEGVAVIIGVDSSIGATYNWSPPKGLASTITSFTLAVPDSQTTYRLIISNTTCTDTILQTVVVIPFDGSILGGDTSICQEATLQLFATGGDTYSWSPANGLNDSSLANPFAMIGNTVTYYVNIFDTNTNCQRMDSIQISLTALQANLEVDTTLCASDVIRLSVLGTLTIKSYLWSTGEESASILVSDPGEYWLTVYQNSCMASDTIDVQSCFSLFVPNVFSPNGDGINDILSLFNREEYLKGNFCVYDRFGKIVFSTNEIHQGWNGSRNGRPQPSGVYTYAVVIQREGSENILITGNVTLSR